MLSSTKINKIFAIFKQENPKPTTELQYNSTFELLIAVILSAQATDKSVNLATKELFKQANTPEKMLALGETKLKKLIQTIGLCNTKAKNIIKTCELLASKHASCVPKNRSDLESLPGVGRKTANVILNTAFGFATIAVDTHIFRVSQRIGLAKGTTPLAIEKQLVDIIPKEYLHDAHHWLILHGRYTCQARTPKCAECAIIKLCEYPNKRL